MTSASRTLHLVACHPETQLSILDALQGRDISWKTFASLDDFSRQYSPSQDRTDCVVLESRNRELSDLTPLISARRVVGNVPILLVSDRLAPAAMITSFRCGATEVLSRPIDRIELLAVLDDLFAAKLSRKIRIDRPETVPGLTSLTRCERIVLEHVLSGMTTQQISRAMHVGHQTVAKHKQHVLRKLGARNEIELVLQIVGHDRQGRQSGGSD